MSASSKRRRRVIDRRERQLVETRRAPTPAANPPQAAATQVAASRFGGCAVCRISSFGSPADAREHGRSAEHQAKVAEVRANPAGRQSRPANRAGSDRPVPAAARRGPRMEEGRPWQLRNSDGSLNLASYSFGAVVGFVELAHDLVSDHVANEERQGRANARLGMADVRGVAQALLAAADRCQAACRKDGRVDRMDASHTRARGAVRTALRVYPYPFDDAEAVAGWLDEITIQATALMQAAFDLFHFHETGEPA